ncbi:MAG: glucose 1-dehydrogenase [Planctomycetes bacterium]|nr:glucose 1-dehydrogenase [Planctomycetota bacterium]
MRLADRVIIVTGAASGLGLAYARRLAEEGAAVVLADIQEGLPGVDNLLASNPRTAFVRTDIRSTDDVQNLIDATKSQFGRIDVLINNAALFTNLARQPFDRLTVKDWEQVLAVNVIGTFLCVQAVVATMRAQKGGKIINVASNVVHKGLPFLLHYVASKGAVMAMTRALARELGEFGITVNAVAPGYVLHQKTAETDEGRDEQVVKLRALPRTLTPDDLLGTVVFLASPESDFITGQTIVVDGGEVFV